MKFVHRNVIFSLTNRAILIHYTELPRRLIKTQPFWKCFEANKTIESEAQALSLKPYTYIYQQ